jgi:cytochrome oxidase Cu insertion factor (SCO1/SenC/PrrC family)
VTFEDDAGRRRALRSLAGQPLIILPLFAQCHTSCPLLAGALKRAVLDAELDPTTLQVFLFSFDPRNTAEDLAELRRAQKLPASWVLGRLTGNDITALTTALDYRAAYVDGDWAHPNAIAIASGDHRVRAFLYGAQIEPTALRRSIDIARGAIDWRTRVAPWTLALGTIALTFSVAALAHLLSRRPARTSRRASSTQNM